MTLAATLGGKRTLLLALLPSFKAEIQSADLQAARHTHELVVVYLGVETRHCYLLVTNRPKFPFAL